MKIMGIEPPKINHKEGVYAVLTGQLRFVERISSVAMPNYGDHIMQTAMLKILQQEWAIIEDDGKGNRKQYFQWRDVPTMADDATISPN